MNMEQAWGYAVTEVLEFLLESNAIEGVTDEQSFFDAKDAWLYLMQFDKLNPQLVRQVHKILMQNQNLEMREKGHYRTCSVWIGSHEAQEWPLIAESIRGWCKEMNENRNTVKEFYPSEGMSKRLHVQYEKIHPFVDGNGRTGRMFMNWHRIKILKLPLLIIHTGKEQQNYYDWFK